MGSLRLPKNTAHGWVNYSSLKMLHILRDRSIAAA
jgi:hypothetical protein